MQKIIDDWTFADALDKVYGKKYAVADEFLELLDGSSDPDDQEAASKEYLRLANEWAQGRNTGIKFLEVRTADSEDHFLWTVEYNEPNRIIQALETL